jgi:hypothetical protein
MSMNFEPHSADGDAPKREGQQLSDTPVPTVSPSLRDRTRSLQHATRQTGAGSEPAEARHSLGLRDAATREDADVRACEPHTANAPLTLPWCPTSHVEEFLASRHYLGPTSRGFAFSDPAGVMVFAKPTSRRLPQDGTWLELVRWCLLGDLNGSQQWRAARLALLRDHPNVTTIVSYSDPSVGHDGGLYRACNWQWAPTWHRLRPPPSGNGAWKNTKPQSVKDRWVYPLRADDRRADLLAVKDEALMRGKRIGYQEIFRGPRLRKSLGFQPREAGSTPAARSIEAVTCP